jgi:2-oxoglutarate ferredoxin oxidoreductase subunit gamma
VADVLGARADRDRSGRFEIRFSGSGGQGILLAAAIVAEAAAAQGEQVVQTQSYGPEARGGASKSEVIVAHDEIDYPEVLTPDISLVLSQAAYVKYAGDTTAEGLLVYDSGLVDPAGAPESWKLCGLPFTQAAADELGKTVVANIVSLGALVAVSDVLPADAVEQAVVSRVPERFRELNAEAFRLGLRLAREAEAAGEEPSAAESASAPSA